MGWRDRNTEPDDGSPQEVNSAWCSTCQTWGTADSSGGRKRHFHPTKTDENGHPVECDG